MKLNLCKFGHWWMRSKNLIVCHRCSEVKGAA